MRRGWALILPALVGLGLPVSGAAQPACGGEGAWVTGIVRSDESAVVLPGVTVTASWPGGRAETLSDASGRYLLCNLPADTEITLQPRFSGFSGEPVTVEAPAGELVELDLVVPMSGGARETRRLGRVAGRVVDAGTLEPVQGVAVGLVGRAAQALTDAAGGFALENIPEGEELLELRHVAFGTQTAPVDVRAGATVSLEVRIAMQPVEVEPIHVEVTGIRDVGLEIRGFYERKQWSERLGLGHFLTAEDIERRNPQRVSHLVADLPETRLNCSGSLSSRGCEILFAGNPSGQGCQRANVYIDGIRVIHSDRNRAGGTIDEFVLPVEVAGIEVYPGAASMPAEFSGSSGRCGAVVIWTK